MKQPIGVVRLHVGDTGDVGVFQILTSTKTTWIRYPDDELSTIVLSGNIHGDVVLERLDVPEEQNP